MPKSQDNIRPIVLCFSGHDPIGGAGIQADIESISANLARAATVITALTVQDTQDVKKVVPIELTLFQDAANTLLSDLPISVFKTGLLADVKIVHAIAKLVQQHPDAPLVIDPVLASGAGTALSNDEFITSLKELLLPLATVATPNLPEAQMLSGETSAHACAEKILATGCKNVLLTGTHANTQNVVNTLYTNAGYTEFDVERLAYDYHGSGCTLASSLAANLANNQDLKTATRNALNYTWNCLNHAEAPGKGQHLPLRTAAHD